ncbi:MAG TPA: S41 family peptidase [Verrucomicrobiae bacterium]
MTRRFFNLFVFALAGLLAAIGSQRALAATATPDFNEVYELVRTNLAGTGDLDLNRTTVESLLSALRPRVSLAADETGTNTPVRATLVSFNLFENDIAYLRAGKIQAGLDDQIRNAYAQLAGTNKLTGVVLDLRYAEGEDYPEVVAVANVFVAKVQPLLDWGNGMMNSSGDKNVITPPVMVLVNHETTGAPEILAAALRKTGSALILGSTTAGGAMVFQEFRLKSGQRLRIATAPVKLGDGTALSAQGVKPDIEVAVSAEDERAYYADAFKAIPKTNQLAAIGNVLTNEINGDERSTQHMRVNEAELVRQRLKDTGMEKLDLPARPPEPQIPQVKDPVLVRALDLLKGLAIVRGAKF